MPRRNGRNGHNGNGHGFNLATVVQIGLIPIIAAGLSIFAQWVTNGDTLKRHDTAISETIPKEFQDEAKAREQTRNEFNDKLGKLNDSLGVLNVHAAVQDEQQKVTNDTLNRISHQLEGATVKPGR